MKLFILFIALIIGGCSTIKNSETYAKKGEWESTFTGIAVSVNSGSQESILKAQELVSKYPEITEYSLNLFTEKNINATSESNENLDYYRFRLKAFCLINTEENCNAAITNLNIADKNYKLSINILSSLFNQLTAQEKQKLLEKYRPIHFSDSEIGIVTDRQVRNLSTPGSNFGAETGGAAGAVAYVNNVNPANYSLSKDVSSTLLGAFVGAALFNKQAVEQYEIRYTVKLRNGDLKQFDVLSSSPLADGIGVCIGMPYGTKVDQSLCTMTLAEFRQKYL